VPARADDQEIIAANGAAFVIQVGDGVGRVLEEGVNPLEQLVCDLAGVLASLAAVVGSEGACGTRYGWLLPRLETDPPFMFGDLVVID